MDQNSSSLEYDNCRDLTHTRIPMQFFIYVKSISRKKSDSSLWEISVSCTSQKYDNVTTPYYPFFAPLFVNWSLTGGWKQRKISNYKNGRGRLRNGTLPPCEHGLKLYKCNINAVEHSGTSVVTGWPCGWSRNRTECSSTTWWMWYLRFNQTLCKEILSMWSCTYFASSFLLRHTPPVLTGLINCFLTFGHFLDKWKKKKKKQGILSEFANLRPITTYGIIQS